MKASRISWPFWLLLLGLILCFLFLVSSQFFYVDHRWPSAVLLISGIACLYVGSITMIFRQIKTLIRWVKKAESKSKRQIRSLSLTFIGLLVAPFLGYYWFFQLLVLPIFVFRG